MNAEHLCFTLILYIDTIFSQELMEYLSNGVLHTQLTQPLMELLE